DLGADHQLVTVDLPGHGATDAVHDTADLPTAAELLADAGGSAIYVGYSMGGRIALHAALQRPETVRGLVLIGATAGLDDPDDRAARREADEALAERLLTIGLEAFLDRWLAAPLFAGLSPSAQCRPARLRNRPAGLAASLRHCGTGTQEPLWDRLSAITAPVLVVAGDDDPKFLAIGERLTATLPDATMRTAPSTHAVHLACPTTTAELVRRFAAEHGLD
ncbi:MAG: alpha/beta fold hydrolase, partial [Actinomycetota bacterium]